MWIFATAVFLVLVFFLYRHPKTTLKVLGVLVGLSLAVVGLIAYNDSTPTKSVDQKEKVAVLVSYDAANCSAEFPLRTVITNRADKALTRISWRVEAFVPGRSSDIVAYDSRWPFDSDYIVEPNQTITLCYKLPKLREAKEPSGLQWQVVGDDRLVSFRW
jgi:hypothetical protein